MQYYIDGRQTSAVVAKRTILKTAIWHGYDPVEIEALWTIRESSEEAREELFSHSDRHIEMSVD